MRILYLHGWRSVVGGMKPTYLSERGHEVIQPALPDDDFTAALAIAQQAFNRHRPEVIVGSSRGGAVALSVNAGTTRLVLLCPAWKKWSPGRTARPGTIILHSPADDVIPFADSEELLQRSGLPGNRLWIVGSDHRLADTASLATLLRAVEKDTE